MFCGRMATAAARAAPYEKGTETQEFRRPLIREAVPRARPPMRRGLKPDRCADGATAGIAARAAPYEKGTETSYQQGHPDRA